MGEVSPKSRAYARNRTNFSGLVGPRKRQFGLRGQLADGSLPGPDVGEEAVGVHGEIRPPPRLNRRAEGVPIDLELSVALPTEVTGRLALDVCDTLRTAPRGTARAGGVLVSHGHLMRYLPDGGERVLWTGHDLRSCSGNPPRGGRVGSWLSLGGAAPHTRNDSLPRRRADC
jgi:hypothetical protein